MARNIPGAVGGAVRRHWIALAVVVSLVLLYTVGGFFVVPRVAQAQAQQFVAKELGRKLQIGAIRFNPFTFEAVVENLDLREADDAPILAFKSLRVNAELASIWTRGVVLKNVRLDDPVVKVIVRPDGALNLAQLAPASAQQQPVPESQPASQAPPRVRIGGLAVENGRVEFEDRSQGKPFLAAIEKIRFGLTDFRMDLDYKNAFGFSATTPADEQFEWSGYFTVRPLGSVGRIAIRNLRAQTLDDYLQDHLPLKLAAGTVTLAADYQVALSPALALDVTVPDIALRDLQVKERAASAEETPVSVAKVDVGGLAYSYAKGELAIKQLGVAGARIDVRRERDGSINLSRLLAAKVEAGQKEPARTEAAAPKTAEPAKNAPAKNQPAKNDGVAAKAANVAPSGSKAAPPLARADAAQPGSQPSPQAGALKIRIDSIQVTDTAVHVEDRAVAPPVRVELKPLAVSVSGWSTDPASSLALDGDITINQAARLLVKGDARLEPLAAQLDVSLRDFALPFLQPYFAPFTTAVLHSARLGVKGKVGYAAAKEGAPAIRFAGAVDLADLRISVPPATEDLLRWKALYLAAIDFSSAPGKLTIDRITVTQPYAQVVIAPDRTLNVAQVLREQPEETRAAASPGGARTRPAPASSPAFPIRIKQVRIVDGSANFADTSIEPSFAAGIVELNGAIDGLSSDPASRAKVKLEGKVDKYAPVDISGEANLLAATKYTDLALNFRNMELTTFNPYSGKFAGYNISKGKLSTELRYKVDNRALQAEHHVIVDNLEFGAKTDSKDAAPIPVKLAVALLKDRKGVIDLQLPVRGSLDDPEFRLGPIIWKAVLGLLTKIVTAPFAALGSLFGGGEELAYVDFAPGTVAVPAAEQAKLEKLATALIERPQLRLDVPHAAADRDADALARTALDQRVAPGPAAADPGAAKRIRVTQLEGVYKQVAKVSPAYPAETQTASGVDVDARLRWIEAAVLDKLKPDKAALETLARQRAQAVQDALLAHKEIDPQRIFITTERKAATPPGGAVRMELKLE